MEATGRDVAGAPAGDGAPSHFGRKRSTTTQRFISDKEISRRQIQ